MKSGNFTGLIRFAVGIGMMLSLVATTTKHVRAQMILGPVTNLGPGVNSSEGDAEASISADRLSLFFHSGRSPADHLHTDLFAATRATVDEPFTRSQRLGPLINTSATEAFPNLSPDGLSLFFTDGVHTGFTTPRPGGLGAADIWVATRETTTDDFSYVENLGAPVNSQFWDGGSSISADQRSLFFSSSRPNGSGQSDLWMATRPEVGSGWNEPVNLGPNVNSSEHEMQATISPDGLSLVFTSFRSPKPNSALWMSSRATISDPWSEAILLPPPYNTSSRNAFGKISPDGRTLFIASDRPGGSGSFDIYQIPIVDPGELPVPINVRDGAYLQSFDEALGADGRNMTVGLPAGWIGTADENVGVSAVTKEFRSGSRIRLRGDLAVMNAGLEQSSDRALATGVSRSGQGHELQFYASPTGGDVNQLRLQFDLEAWGSELSTSSPPGEAAFHLLAEIDTGNGFEQVLDLGTVKTGTTLVVPEDRRLINGNDDAYRVEYDSGWHNDVNAPEDATLRLRWITDTSGATAGWTFGLDNVILELGILGDLNRDGILGVDDVDLVSHEIWDPSGASLFDLTSDGNVSQNDVDYLLALTNRLNGDADFDGEVQFSDFLVLSNNFGQENRKWSEGDFDSNGSVQFADFLILSDSFGGSAMRATAVPEPDSLILVTFAVVGMLLRSRNLSRLGG